MTPIQSLDPPLRACKWILALGGVTLILLRAWAEHRFFMDLPMFWRHALELGSDALLLILMAAVFALVMRYENRLAALNAELEARNHAMEQLEATVDKRLIELAQKLALSLASVAGHAGFALQNTTNISDIKAFSQVVDEAHNMAAITNELIELKRLEAGSGEIISADSATAE